MSIWESLEFLYAQEQLILSISMLPQSCSRCCLASLKWSNSLQIKFIPLP